MSQVGRERGFRPPASFWYAMLRSKCVTYESRCGLHSIAHIFVMAISARTELLLQEACNLSRAKSARFLRKNANDDSIPVYADWLSRGAVSRRWLADRRWPPGRCLANGSSICSLITAASPVAESRAAAATELSSIFWRMSDGWVISVTSYGKGRLLITIIIILKAASKESNRDEIGWFHRSAPSRFGSKREAATIRRSDSVNRRPKRDLGWRQRWRHRRRGIFLGRCSPRRRLAGETEARGRLQRGTTASEVAASPYVPLPWLRQTVPVAADCRPQTRCVRSSAHLTQSFIHQ